MILWSNDYARPRYRQHVRLRLVPRRSHTPHLRAWWRRRDPIVKAVVLTAAAVVAGGARGGARSGDEDRMRFADIDRRLVLIHRAARRRDLNLADALMKELLIDTLRHIASGSGNAQLLAVHVLEGLSAEEGRREAV